MARGGRRVGAGRPGGAGNAPPRAQSREITVARAQTQEDMAGRTTILPSVNADLKAIEVMRENMMWARDIAAGMLAKMEDAARAGEYAVAIDWHKEHLTMRKYAQKCAEALAPYQDPKLSASVPAEPPPVDITPGAPGVDRLAHLTDRYRHGLTVHQGGKVKQKG